MTPTEKAKPGRPPKKQGPTAAVTNTNAAIAMAKAKAFIFKACGTKPVAPTYSTMPHLASGSTIVNLLIGGSPAKDGKGSVCPGYPRKHYTEIYGAESCLDADTFIQYTVRRSDGTFVNGKGGTIQRLFKRFHNLPALGNGQGKYQRPRTLDAEFYAPSVNEYDRIFQNRILDVVDAGTQECFELVTSSGFRITATAEHKFFTGVAYSRLGDLKVGDLVQIHNNTHFRTSVHKTAPHRKMLYVKHHPVAGVKIAKARVNRTSGMFKEYPYHRLPYARAVVEASLNNLSVDAYVARLDANDLEGLQFLDRNAHVHHRDENIFHDDLSNLEVLSSSEHGILHATERHNNLRFISVPDEIVSITAVSLRKVYDLKMTAPFNNFVADGFVVHNSGKTTLALSAVVSCQREGGVAMYIDFEHSLHHGYAKAIGVDFSEDKLLFYQPDTFEEGIKMLYLGIRAGIDLIVVDSVAAMVPKAELEKDIGDPARIGALASAMSGLLPKLVIWLSNPEGMGKAKKTGNDEDEEPTEKASKVKHPGTALIFINQLRALIQSGYGKGGPTEHTPGGKALKFYAHVRLNLRRRKSEVINKKDPLTGKDKNIPFGNLVEVKVDKTKCAGQQGYSGEIFIRYGYGLDDLLSLIEAGTVRRIIGKVKSSLTYEGETFRGRESMRKYLLEHPEKVEMLKAQIYSSILGDSVQSQSVIGEDEDEVLSEMQDVLPSDPDDDDDNVSANAEAEEEVEVEEG